MKSQKGVTLTSLAIYITIVLIVIGILATITANLQGNIKEIYAEGTNNSEIDKFNVYFLKEVKKQGNEIDKISDDKYEVLFTTGNRYTYNSSNKCIYLNNSIKIAENIEKCKFFEKIENQKIFIKVTIKAINGEEKSIDYVLSNEEVVGDLEDETNYTNYIPENWDVSKLNSETPVKFEVIDNEVYLAPIPKGFEISTETGENTISGGLVISDENGNEFVWVPVENALSYTEESFGPLTGTDSTSTYLYDSQDELDYYYGTGYYNYSDFTYSTDKTNVETNIRTYGGFYVGRYETTIDGSTIGVQAEKTVLTMATLLKEGINTKSNDEYHYRWWGLYKEQKDIYEDDEYVGSLMITSKQWDEIMTFTGYGDTIRDNTTYTTKPDLSSSKYLNTTETYDVSKNIYDLAGNVREHTLIQYSASLRYFRGGRFDSTVSSTNNAKGKRRYQCTR